MARGSPKYRPQEPQTPKGPKAHPPPSPPGPQPPGAPHRTVIGDDLLLAVQALGPVVDQHEVPAAALRAPHEVQEERSALQAGGALGREHRLRPGPGPGRGPRQGMRTGPTSGSVLEPPAPALTRSGYSVPTQPPHIAPRPAPPRNYRESCAPGRGSLTGRGLRCRVWAGPVTQWAWSGGMGGG